MIEKYRTQVASDIVRDGLGLELVDERGCVLAEVFRCDADRTVALEFFAEAIPPLAIDRLTADAEQKLAPFEDGTPLPPRNAWVRFYRDFSGKLTFALDAEAERFPELKAFVVTSFELRSLGPSDASLDATFQSFDSYQGPVSLHWDNWVGFTVAAGAPQSEDLVRRIARKLTSEPLPNSGLRQTPSARSLVRRS
jgi:hypothetical protein